jgi:hypothetical protein
MKTYIIKNTDIMHKGKIFPEGSTIDLEDKEAESLSDFLDLIKSDSSKSLEPVIKPETKKRSNK